MQELQDDIIDCDVLEAAKENIQPLAKGRRVTVLSAVLSKDHRERERQLSAGRAHHRQVVQDALDTDDENVDVLGAYVAFVDWTVQHYPQGHNSESGIVELLEEATRALKDDRRWRNDPRYLDLWIQYASYVERPLVIYAFLVSNEIATQLARLYVEYATVLEREGR